MSGILIRGFQFGQQQLLPAEHVQRQIMLAIVVAIEEPAILVPMKQIIGGIQIQNDFFGDLFRSLHKGVDEEPIDRFFAVVDLLILLVFLCSDSVGFQSVQRSLAGQGIPTIPSTVPVYCQ